MLSVSKTGDIVMSLRGYLGDIFKDVRGGWLYFATGTYCRFPIAVAGSSMVQLIVIANDPGSAYFSPKLLTLPDPEVEELTAGLP